MKENRCAKLKSKDRICEDNDGFKQEVKDEMNALLIGKVYKILLLNKKYTLFVILPQFLIKN